MSYRYPRQRTSQSSIMNFFSLSGAMLPFWIRIQINTVSKAKRNHARLAELGLPTLQECRHQADMAMVHKIPYGGGSLAQWFERAADSVRATRSTVNPF
jgi:hypothetical protein